MKKKLVAMETMSDDISRVATASKIVGKSQQKLIASRIAKM